MCADEGSPAAASDPACQQILAFRVALGHFRVIGHIGLRGLPGCTINNGWALYGDLFLDGSFAALATVADALAVSPPSAVGL